MLPCQIVGIANFSVRNLKNFVSLCEEIRSSVSSAFCFGPVQFSHLFQRYGSLGFVFILEGLHQKVAREA